MSSVILFLKSHVAGYMRGGRYVKPYQRQGGPTASAASGQLALFPAPPKPPAKPNPYKGLDPMKATPDMFEDERAAARKQALQAKYSDKAGPTDDEAADPRRKYYVTMAREGRGVARLAGPFDTHDEALAHVDRAREEAEKADPRASFDSFGTAGVVSDDHRPGVLNQRLGIGASTAPSPVTVAGRRRVRDPLEGTHTELTLSNGKVARIQRMSSGSTMGLPGWHDLDGGQHSYLDDTEEGAVKEVLRRHSAAS